MHYNHGSYVIYCTSDAILISLWSLLPKVCLLLQIKKEAQEREVKGKMEQEEREFRAQRETEWVCSAQITLDVK